MQLFDISTELLQLEEELEELLDNAEATHEAIDRYLQKLDGTIADRDKKLDGYAALIKMLEFRSDARKAEADRLRKRGEVDANKIKSLKWNLQQFFVVHNLKTIETDRYRLTLAKNGGKAPMFVSPIGISEVPDKYVVVTKDIDRAAVRKDLEAGEILEFAHLGDRGTSIRIK